jgi:hypothetical protein
LDGNILRPEQLTNKSMPQITKNLIILSAIFALFIFPVFSSPVFAQTGDDKNYGLNTAASNTGLIRDQRPQEIIGVVVGSALSLLGVIFFLLVIYAGIRWMLAQGNEQEVEKAKQILIAAIIGLIIVLAAYAVTSFIGGQLTGTGTAPATPPQTAPDAPQAAAQP